MAVWLVQFGPVFLNLLFHVEVLHGMLQSFSQNVINLSHNFESNKVFDNCAHSSGLNDDEPAHNFGGKAAHELHKPD